MKKDLDQLVRRLVREHGCTVTDGGHKHRKIRGPNGGIVVTACSPSSYRGILNFISDVRRQLGINLKEHK